MEVEQLKQHVLAAVEDMKGVNVTVLDVRGRSTITDYMVVASGTSERHITSIAERTVEKLKAAGVRPLGTEDSRGGGWVLVDFGELVLHVMLPEVRTFYNLEKLWAV